MTFQSKIEKIKKWFNEKPERKKEIILAICLTVNLLLTTILLGILQALFSIHLDTSPTFGSKLLGFLSAGMVLFYLFLFSLFILLIIFFLMYLEIILMRPNFIEKIIEDGKNKKLFEQA